MSFNKSKYQNEYQKKHYTQIKLALRKDEAALWKQLAADKGIPLVTYLRQAVAEYGTPPSGAGEGTAAASSGAPAWPET